jgi:hypothetical protein
VERDLIREASNAVASTGSRGTPSARHDVGASSREDAKSDVASDHSLSRLVDRAVPSEDQNGIEVAVDRISRQVGRVVPGIGIDNLELEVGRQRLDDDLLGARRNRACLGVRDQQNCLHGAQMLVAPRHRAALPQAPMLAPMREVQPGFEWS